MESLSELPLVRKILTGIEVPGGVAVVALPSCEVLAEYGRVDRSSLLRDVCIFLATGRSRDVLPRHLVQLVDVGPDYVLFAQLRADTVVFGPHVGKMYRAGRELSLLLYGPVGSPPSTPPTGAPAHAWVSDAVPNDAKPRGGRGHGTAG